MVLVILKMNYRITEAFPALLNLLLHMENVQEAVIFARLFQKAVA